MESTKYFSFNKMILLNVLFVLSFVISSSTFAQSQRPIKPITENTSSFYEVQSSMNDYWLSKNAVDGFVNVNGSRSKMPGWKLYKRWEYFWEQRVNQSSGEFPSTNSVIEYEKYLQSNNHLNKTMYDESWTNLGTNSSTGGYAGIGRINCIAFHPTDVNTFWVGSPSGGIWRTTNGGTSWTILNDNQLVLGVSDIVIPGDYATSNTIYIATGDRDGGSMWSLSGGQNADNVSIGVLKSTDGGTTWSTTGLSYTKNLGKIIYRLLIHPSNNSILFASTSDGIYKSTNGGTDWVSKSLNRWIDMEFKPGDPTVIYASSYGYTSTYINRSTDSGENWSFSSIATDGRRGEIAVTPADPSVVYLLSANSGGGVYGVYKSTNSGASFTVVNAGSPAGMLGYYTDGSGGSGGQGSYDWCIAVSPTNANTVFIGGITTWKSTNGGTTFTANTNWTSYSGYNISGVPVTHADKHCLVYQNSSVLFEGNDGGIYKTTNGGISWIDLSDGLIISQIYRIGVSQTSQTTVLTGLQDNGTKLYNSGWTDVKGGDGMECIVDPTNSNYMYATYVRGQITRSINGFTNWVTEVDISANIPGGQPQGAWVTPYVMDKNSSTTLFAGYDRIWKTTNRGDSWTSASQVLSSSDKLRSLAIAPSNSNVLYTADRTNMWKTTNGGSTNWTAVTIPTTSLYVTYIAVKEDDPNTVWITYGGYSDGIKVYESTNGGTSWTNISTGLPNLPVMCIVHYKAATNRNVLFVGTDVGVYVKDGSNNWASFNNGLPNVVVTELDIYYGGVTNKLRAGTYGRGLWETNIDATLPVELSSFTATINNNFVVLNWTTKTETNNFGFEVERTSNVKGQMSNELQSIGFVNGSGNSNSPVSYVYEDKSVSSGKYSYRLKQIDNDGQYSYSNIVEVDVSVPNKFSLEQNYPNPFNPTTKIKFTIPQATYPLSGGGRGGLVTLKVYDVLGNEVASLVNEYKTAASYEIEFDASNLSSGVYYYQLKAGDPSSNSGQSFIQTKKMILIK
ncbi:MAG: T9SS type A sorting domain-containing protein [Ignavibacteriales bacterium]|nr:MAG: T9SS type A sorting domain-containing protein [Ignavibacteriales bacterium]